MSQKMEFAYNTATLSFKDKNLEASFRNDYFEKRVPQLRLDLILGILLYTLFGIHDYWAIPDIKEFAWLIRYGIVCPILVGVLIFSYSGYFRKIMEFATFIAGFAAGGVVVLMIAKAAPPGNYISYAALLIILLFYFRLRFVTASALTWSIFTLSLAVAACDTQTPSNILYSNIFIMLTFSCTGLFMCYTLEQNNRSSFLLRRTIQERNSVIAETNREFEKEIEERRQAENALLEQMEFLRTLLDTIPNPIFYTDVNGRYAGCNRAYEIFFGQPKDELTGSSALDLYIADSVHGSDEGESQENSCQGIRTGEALLRHADGTDHNVLFSRAMYVDIEGNPAGMVGVVLDISDLKKAEEEKLRLETQIFQSQKIEALGQLAGGIAHEFNNILTAILGYSHILRKKMNDSDPLIFFVDNTITSGERAAGLIRDILAFGRKQKINPVLVDLNEVVKKSVSLLKMMIGEDIDLAVSLCNEPIRVMADGNLISQILMNLAANAKDAMPRGGLVSISASVTRVDHELRHIHGTAQPGNYGMIAFSDTGIGMDAKTRERIFEPFFTTKEVGKGTGLGLSIVYGIIKQHNGCIDMETEFTKGTTFRIYLPAAAGELVLQHATMTAQSSETQTKTLTLAAARQPDPEICPYPSGTETVLVAEDNDTVRTLTRNLLQENGYTVIEACTGDDAIQRFMEHADKIRLLLLDVIMPKKNGWEVYDTIRKIRPNVQVIFMSGYAADVFAKKIIPEEEMNILQKPVPPGSLLRALRMELDRESMEKETNWPASAIAIEQGQQIPDISLPGG